MRGFLWKVATNTLLAIVIGAAPTQAQLATQHIKGTTGLKAGSQPPPHATLSDCSFTSIQHR